MSRTSLPAPTEEAILTLSRRRCSLCFGLHRDSDVKRGQIAHIDRNPGDNSVRNLVYLCIPHHDDYDTIPRQSKRFTSAELVKYRDGLYAFLDVLLKPAANRQMPERSGTYDEYERLIPSRWRHVYLDALTFCSETTHRTQSAVLSLVDGQKTLEEINSAIPPNDLDWTASIVREAVKRGYIVATGSGKFKMTVYAATLIEALAEIPEAVKEDAWRRNWAPDDLPLQHGDLSTC